MSNTADVSYKWSEKGKQPLIEQKQYKRERLTLFGAVNPISGEVIVQKPERKRKNLIRLGVDQEHAYAWSRTRKGGWAIAQSPILNTTITLERLRKRGYISLLDVYTLLNPSICEPPYTRTVRTVV